MENENRELKVSAIKDGTVIDHIPAEKLFNVINILNLDKIDTLITFGTNLESKQHGKKAIIKIANKCFKGDETPDVKLNVIKNYKVVEKKQVVVPDTIEGIVKCVNPKCITNHENVKTKFTVIDKKNIKLKCHYCEKITI